MKRLSHLSYHLMGLCSFLFIGNVFAQTPSDAIMMEQKQFCVAAIYEYSWFDQYWEGGNLRSNGTIETVKRNMYSPMVAIGVFDKLNLLVSAPYVQTKSTEPNGGYFAGAEGFQDLNLALKGHLFNKEITNGDIDLLATVGYAFPMTNYLSDYRPYSIGNGTDELSVRAILQYYKDSGLYIRGSLAYLFRGTTEAERDYYYNEGSYYTATMDVPSAWGYNFVVGKYMFNSALKLEINYNGETSVSGDDIRPYNAAQPTNKTNFGRLGVFTQYYFNKPEGLGIIAYFAQTIHGRNVGKSSVLGGGFNYIF